MTRRALSWKATIAMLGILFCGGLPARGALLAAGDADAALALVRQGLEES